MGLLEFYSIRAAGSALHDWQQLPSWGMHACLRLPVIVASVMGFSMPAGAPYRKRGATASQCSQCPQQLPDSSGSLPRPSAQCLPRCHDGANAFPAPQKPTHEPWISVPRHSPSPPTEPAGPWAVLHCIRSRGSKQLSADSAVACPAACAAVTTTKALSCLRQLWHTLKSLHSCCASSFHSCCI